MIHPISPQFSLNLQDEASTSEKELTLYKVARVATYVALAILEIGGMVLVHLFAPQFTFLTLSLCLALTPVACKLTTSVLSSKIHDLQERVHHFSGAHEKQIRLNTDPVTARLRQIEEDTLEWNRKKTALQSGNPTYSSRKKAYHIEEFEEFPLKIQAAYFSHLLQHRHEHRPLADFGRLNFISAYKLHLDTRLNAPTPRPFFIKPNGSAVPRQLLETGTPEALRLAIFNPPI